MTLPATYSLFNASVSGTTEVNGATQPTDADEVTYLIIVDVGVLKGTSPTCDVQIQHSPNGTTWVDHPTVITQFTADGQSITPFTNLDANVRAQVVLGGTTPSAYVQVGATARKG